MKVILDTMAHIAEYKGKTPEKWQRVWNQLSLDRSIIILTEPLVSEIYYRIAILDGQIAAECYLLTLKSKKNIRIIPCGDGDKMAFQAAKYKLKHRRHGISVVDSYVLAAALIERATIFTADHGIRDAGNEEKCSINYIPKGELVKYVQSGKNIFAN
jgi:predicted nucleic acid-binding protein